MFKYNELSDLLNSSELVIPLEMTSSGSIRCIDKDGNECFYEFEDFDFDKLVEERVVQEEQPEQPETPEQESTLEEPERDDSEFDGSDEDVAEEEEGNQDEDDAESRFLSVSETISFINSLNNSQKNKSFNSSKVKIWRDVVK